MSFITDWKQKIVLNFSLNSLNITAYCKHQKKLNLLNEVSDSKFVTRKWKIVNDQSNVNFDAGNEIIYNTEVSKPNLGYFNDTYILVDGDITTNRRALPTEAAFNNCAPFTKSITKISRTTIDDAEDLDLVMPT